MYIWGCDYVLWQITNKVRVTANNTKSEKFIKFLITDEATTIQGYIPYLHTHLRTPHLRTSHLQQFNCKHDKFIIAEGTG